MNTFLILGSVALALTLLALWRRQISLRREQFIRTSTLPNGLFERLRKRHPDLTLKDCQLVARGLRQFFLAHLKSGRKFVSMPSQIADDLWHEFILFTKNYEAFCGKAFGRFLHHTPAVVLSDARQSNAGLRRCWWYACLEDNINPRLPSRLPLLFALDAKLNIPDGFRYAADCRLAQRGRQGRIEGGAVHCGGDFSSTSFDGGTDGFGDSGSGGGDGGSSCGGGGCGGGGD